MLPRQQGRRRDDRNLKAGHGCDKGRPHGNFRLAKAHIATDQTVHRVAAGQIIKHIRYCGHLIFGFGIGETCGKRIPHARRWVHYRRFAQGALRSYADKLVRHLADAFLELGFL